MDSNYLGPINLSNPHECSIRQLAEIVCSRTNSDLPLVFNPLPPDDPRQRQPDISLLNARSSLVSLRFPRAGARRYNLLVQDPHILIQPPPFRFVPL